MKNIKNTLEKVYNISELRKNVVPLFLGNPGVGKTQLIQEFAKEKGVKLIELITSQMSPFEVTGICIPDKDTKKMTYYNFDKLDSLEDNDILFLDEFGNGNPVVANAILTTLQDRKLISGKKLPDIMIVAAANPQGMMPLTPQIKERFIWYDVKFDKSMWKSYMEKKYFMPHIISDKLCKLIQEETFNGYNFITPRSIDKAVNMIIYDCYTPYQSTLIPILSTIITNNLGGNIELSNGEELKPNESIEYLKLIKILKNGIINK